MQKKRLNSVTFKIFNIILSLLILISWLYIASLNWTEPPWFTEPPWLRDPYWFSCICNSTNDVLKNYILNNFIPNIALLFTFISIFFLRNTMSGNINYLERKLMKFTFSCMALTSILFIGVFRMPEPQYLILYNYQGYINYSELIQNYFSFLSVINILIIFISLVGLLLMSKLKLIRRL
ncbi:MAG: hypothetical protein ACFFA4_05575 [Promethearchaeota archaeon]